jgi:hypothetical protein
MNNKIITESQAISRIGEKYITTEGYNIEIVKYVDSKNCDIRFDDGLIINAQYHNIKKGQVKNPNHIHIPLRTKEEKRLHKNEVMRLWREKNRLNKPKQDKPKKDKPKVFRKDKPKLDKPKVVKEPKEKFNRLEYQREYRVKNYVKPERNYLNNRDLHKELYYCKELGYITPQLTNMFIILTKNVVGKMRHKTIEDKEDSIQSCVLRLLTFWYNYDHENRTNAFAYFTEVIKRAMAETWNKQYSLKGMKGENVELVRIANLTNGRL